MFVSPLGCLIRKRDAMTYTNYYEYLLAKKRSGELKLLFALGLPTQLTLWMKICEYHLRHMEVSQLKTAIYFGVSAKTVWKAYSLLQPIV